MADYNKTMWVNNETVVDAQKLNKLENQMHLMTVSSNTNSERLANLEDVVDTKIDDVETVETDDGNLTSVTQKARCFGYCTKLNKYEEIKADGWAD